MDLNYDNPKTRQRMIDVMQYWVREFNIDGYRADASLTGVLSGETISGETLSLGPYGYRLLWVE